MNHDKEKENVKAYKRISKKDRFPLDLYCMYIIVTTYPNSQIPIMAEPNELRSSLPFMWIAQM